MSSHSDFERRKVDAVDLHTPTETRAPDADPSVRPGIPMELSPPRPAGAAHWKEPERQAEPDAPVLKRKGLKRLTPVFGTTLPPRGLSGLLRRAAYRIADHRTSHWLLLLVADRVDVAESRLRPAVPLAAAGVVGLGLLFVRNLRLAR